MFFFGMFLLTFIPPLDVTHTHIFVQAQSASQLALLEPPPSLLPCFVLRPTSISRPFAASRCDHSRSFSVSSRDECIQSSLQSHVPFTLTVTIIAVEPGFIMVQEELKAVSVGLDATKNTTILRSWRRTSLAWNPPGLTIQWRYSL